MAVFSHGLLSLIYIPLPGGAGVINIGNIRINDLSFHDGLKRITEMDTGQSHIKRITEYCAIKSPPVVFTAVCLNSNKSLILL